MSLKIKDEIKKANLSTDALLDAMGEEIRAIREKIEEQKILIGAYRQRITTLEEENTDLKRKLGVRNYGVV